MSKLRAHLPSSTSGLLVTLALAVIASLIAAGLAAGLGPLPALPSSPMVVAIFLGLALSGAAARQPQWEPGLGVARGLLLKTAVALIGLRLSVADLWLLGGQALPLVLLTVSAGLILVLGLLRLVSVDRRLSGLIAAGTAVCGASAIAALAPAVQARSNETCYALACIALIGLIATVAYPLMLPRWLDDPVLVGLVLGSAVHDTAQVMAAASAFEQLWQVEGTIDAATVTKLLRNLSLILVIPMLTLALADRTQVQRPPFPLFILAFIGLAGLRTVIDATPLAETAVWATALQHLQSLSQLLFAMAMAALAMAVRPRDLRLLGWQPAIVALVAAAGMLGVALLWVST